MATLINGLILKGEPCPFIDTLCKGGMGEGRCPTKDKPFNCDYSCGLARGFDLCDNIIEKIKNEGEKNV